MFWCCSIYRYLCIGPTKHQSMLYTSCVFLFCLFALPSRHFWDCRGWKSGPTMQIWDCGMWKSGPCLLGYIFVYMIWSMCPKSVHVYHQTCRQRVLDDWRNIGQGITYSELNKSRILWPSIDTLYLNPKLSVMCAQIFTNSARSSGVHEYCKSMLIINNDMEPG